MQNSKDTTRYLSGQVIVRIHDSIVEKDPLTPSGILYPGMEDSAAERPKTVLYNYVPYPSVFVKAASLLDAICRWHIFLDGNKRTALAATTLFLFHNGYFLTPPLSTIRFAVEVAQGKLEIDEIAKWLRTHSHRYRMVSAIVSLGYFVGLLLFVIFGVFYMKHVTKKIEEWMAFDIYPEGRDEWLRRLQFRKLRKRRAEPQ
ncbi:MAG: type II toxin-antitoxin system death-on-curing family toxin [Candidatus Bathyarchaeia archaeon]